MVMLFDRISIGAYKYCCFNTALYFDDLPLDWKIRRQDLHIFSEEAGVGLNAILIKMQHPACRFSRLATSTLNV